MYNILLRFLYLLLSYFGGIYPKKYKNWFLEQKKVFVSFKRNKTKSIWIHCSSLGEYENIKALIPRLKKINSNINITFFSSSGPLHFQDFELINQISYLPIDTKSNMKQFIYRMNPMMVIVSKNDVWPNMVTYLTQHNIPLYLIGCKINPKKTKNFFINMYYREYFSKFNFIFCQDNTTSKFLNTNNICKNSIVGDTRTNQVLIDSKIEFYDKTIKQFVGNKKVIVYGSVENSDYTKIINTICSRKDIKHIVVPHEINNKTIQHLKEKISDNVLLYSNMRNSASTNSNILIVDVFGLLKHLYRFSQIAYIGGGFNNGVHNTLEPAIHGNFIIFGPKHQSFPETFTLIKKEIAEVVKNKLDFEKNVNRFLEKKSSKEKIINLISFLFNEKRVDLDFIINYMKKENNFF